MQSANDLNHHLDEFHEQILAKTGSLRLPEDQTESLQLIRDGLLDRARIYLKEIVASLH